MASDITISSASFTTTNMKPANSEVIPAVWGQNVADNTGYLKYQIETKKEIACTYNFGTNSADGLTGLENQYFHLGGLRDLMEGTIAIKSAGDAGVTADVDVYIDGSVGTTLTMTRSGGIGNYTYENSFSESVSSLTNDLDYPFKIDLKSTNGLARVAVSSWVSKS